MWCAVLRGRFAERAERGQRPAGDFLDRPGRVDADQDVLVGVERDERGGLLGVDLEPVPDRVLGVVVALEQLAAAVVADAGPGRRVEGGVPEIGRASCRERVCSTV